MVQKHLFQKQMLLEIWILLNEIESKANDLGIDVSEVYPDFEEHKRTIEYLEDLEKRFDDQKGRLERFTP